MKHILIAEDDIGLQMSLSFILEDEGYQITKASDGNIAIKILKESTESGQKVDLLITDIQMPDLNGLQLIKRMREIKCHVPVIVITGYGDKKTLIELIRLGCDDFLGKPFEPDDVCEKVKEVLEKQRLSDEAIEKTHAELIKINTDLSHEIESYKQSFSSLRKEIDNAVVTYQDLISIKPDGYKVPIHYHLKNYRDLGGDYFDIRDTDEGCDLIIADVAGHDMAASYHTVMIKSFFDENCRTKKSGQDFFHILNHALLENGKNERMVTAMFLRLNFKKMIGEVVSAGHPKMIRLTQKLPIATQVNIEGSVLGLFQDVVFDSMEFRLVPKDRIILHTDGITNAKYVDGPTGSINKLSEEELCDFINEYKENSLNKLIDNVWNDIQVFCRYKPSDDMLIVGLEIPEKI